MGSPAVRPALRRQVGWTLAGNVGYAACQWGMIVILAKALPPDVVGQFGLGLALSAPVYMMTNLQLRSIQATGASGLFQLRDYLGFRLLATAVGLLAIVMIALSVEYPAATQLVILGVGILKGLEAVADTLYGHLQKAEAMDRIALSMIAKGAASLAVLAAVVLTTHNLVLGLLAVSMTSLIILLLYDLPSARRTGGSSEEIVTAPRWSVSTFQGIARLGLPLGIASLLLALATTVPRYFLERFHGEAALGYFSALAYPTAAFSILLSAFGQAATPRMAESYPAHRALFRRTVLLLTSIPVLMTGVALLVVAIGGPRILALLYRQEYAAYFDVFIVLLLSGAAWSLASVLGYAATASRRFVDQAPAALVIAAAGVLSSWFLVPKQGLMGAALAMGATGVVAIATYGALLLRLPDSRDAAPSTVPVSETA